MTERPAYKSHPLWGSAMALTREAYALAESVRERRPGTARRIRKAAVSVPARIAAAVSEGEEKRRERVLAARGALAEVARQAARVPGEDSRELIRKAETLELSVLFELGEEGVS
jgi:four helix bundle protein